MPGPPPNPNARYRQGTGSPPGRKGAGVLKLPAGGRTGPVPAWPLADASTAERALWSTLWRKPQAVAWERDHLDREVAMYCRWSLLAERADPKAAVESRMLADRLGLNAMALRRLMWEIPADEMAEKRADRVSTPSTAKPRPRRVKAVDASDVSTG